MAKYKYQILFVTCAIFKGCVAEPRHSLSVVLK